MGAKSSDPYKSAMKKLIDPFGREVTYLRVSVTDRCNYRCTYCMSENMTFLPKADILTLEELDRVCSAFIESGVDKIRITGGEPLVRRGVMKLFESLERHLDSGLLKEITLTTNGSQLAKYAQDLANCGVKRINVSVDSLDQKKFETITRWGKLKDVLDGIEAAKRAGLMVKINTVALKGINDDEIDELLIWCARDGHDLTFIETMPMGDVDYDWTDQYLSLTILREKMEENWTLDDIDFQSGGPANYVNIRETGQRVGFITPHTHNFCESCNRVRLTCTGTLYMCLGQEDSVDLREPLRSSESNNFLLDAIDTAIAHKPKGHDFIVNRPTPESSTSRHMNVTGG